MRASQFQTHSKGGSTVGYARPHLNVVSSGAYRFAARYLGLLSFVRTGIYDTTPMPCNKLYLGRTTAFRPRTSIYHRPTPLHIALRSNVVSGDAVVDSPMRVNCDM